MNVRVLKRISYDYVVEWYNVILQRNLAVLDSVQVHKSNPTFRFEFLIYFRFQPGCWGFAMKYNCMISYCSHIVGAFVGNC